VTDQLVAAVVGTSFGARIHVPALRAAGVEVRALVGRDPERTRERADALGIPMAATSLDAVLDDASIGCVTVATPPDAHAEVVLAALGAGRHVLCEKPFAADAGEARAMADAAADAGVVGVVGCEFRWVPDEELARRTIASGAIGTPRLATYVQHSRLLVHGLHGAFNDEWWFDRSRGGGILGGGGIHYVDRFRTWLGEIVAVSAFLQVVGDRPADQAEDTYTITMRFESGCLGLIQHCAATHADPLRVCRVVGSAGTVSLEADGLTVHDRDRSRSVPAPDELALPDPPPPSDDVKHSFSAIELPPYTRLAERFRDEVLGRPVAPGSPPTPTFEDAWRGQLVLDAVRASSREGGRWIDIAAVR
jgi:predicted dehydrogenase